MMYCPNCGKSTQTTAKFCNSCGVQLHATTIPSRPGFKAIVLNIFNLIVPKSIVESIVLYIISLAAIIPIYFVVPLTNDTNTYRLNAFICFVFVVMVGLLKRLQGMAWFWAVIAAGVGYIIGSYAGLIVLIPVFMGHPQTDPSSLGQIEKDFVFAYYKKGILLYLLGAIVTIGSYALSQDGTYTIWYGAVLWGIITIFQGIYYQSRPDIVLNKINDYYSKNGQYPKQNNFWQVSAGFKKFLVYLLVLIIVVSIIITLFNL